MSGRRTSGSSKPSLGVQVLAVFSFISWGKSQFKKCLGKRLEVPDILLPDIRGLLMSHASVQNGAFWAFLCVFVLLASVSVRLFPYQDGLQLERFFRGAETRAKLCAMNLCI